MRSLGVDVGGPRKGLDAVLLDETKAPQEMRRHLPVQTLGDLIAQVDPDVVAIDSPPRWARPGARSRDTERRIAKAGILCFAAPASDAGEANPFSTWMVEGFRAFRIAAGRGYERFAGSGVERTAIEVFPHATAVVLARRLGPPGPARRAWRRNVLSEWGVDVEHLRSPDQVDAALAALTGLRALQGQFCAPGDPEEGIIVLPVKRLRDRYRPDTGRAVSTGGPIT